MNQEMQALQEQNVLKAIQDGPRARTDYNVFVVARDRTARRVLIGGLGSLGVGQMWFPEQEQYVSYPGFENAPDQIFRE